VLLENIQRAFPFLECAIERKTDFALECPRLTPRVLVSSRNWGLQANAH